jgi:hypothetical protein
MATVTGDGNDLNLILNNELIKKYILNNYLNFKDDTSTTLIYLNDNLGNELYFNPNSNVIKMLFDNKLHSVLSCILFEWLHSENVFNGRITKKQLRDLLYDNVNTGPDSFFNIKYDLIKYSDQMLIKLLNLLKNTDNIRDHSMMFFDERYENAPWFKCILKNTSTKTSVLVNLIRFFDIQNMQRLNIIQPYIVEKK